MCYSGWCCSAGPACSTEARRAAPAEGVSGTVMRQKKLGTGKPPPCHGPAPTSVTTLRTPRIRSEVWKRLGLAFTASRTWPTKSRSWMGSAHKGPPSCRHKGQMGREPDQRDPCEPLTSRGPTWCRCPQCSHSGATGGPQAAENLTLHREVVRGRQPWDAPFTSLLAHHCLPAARGP